MGTEIYFQKPNGDLFEMGKTRTGWWHDFMSDYRGSAKLLPHTDDLAKELARCAREFGSWEDDLELDEYCSEIAQRLTDWAGASPVTSLIDCTDYCDFRRITGTRYNRE